jgi:hypothetical protein
MSILKFLTLLRKLFVFRYLELLVNESQCFLGQANNHSVVSPVYTSEVITPRPTKLAAATIVGRFVGYIYQDSSTVNVYEKERQLTSPKIWV